jgi:hypothetical protein
MPAAKADEPTLMRAMYGLAPDTPMPQEVAAAALPGEGATA